MADKNENLIDLSKIRSDEILLVFYASWCPHCQELVPQLNEFFKSNKGIDVLSI